MGRELALVFAIAGREVYMSDQTLELAQKAKDLQVGVLEREVKKGRMEGGNEQAILGRIHVTDKLEDMKDCDLIIEAAAELFDVKSEIFKRLDAICKPETVLVTNTSSFLVTRLSSAVSAERKGRFIGMHFFSPATVMKLVEIVPGQVCQKEIAGACYDFAKELGKTPIKVRDNCGFAVNRIFNILTAEAVRLYEEGVASVEDIDLACKLGLGHPAGPFEMLDNLDIHLNYLVNMEFMSEHGERWRPRPVIVRKVHAGEIGRKVGKGFYKYVDNKKAGPLHESPL
jgi:3-hydroxybutyryl-CoA dehydrogenase